MTIHKKRRENWAEDCIEDCSNDQNEIPKLYTEQ